MHRAVLVTVVLGLALANLASAISKFKQDYAELSGKEEKAALGLTRNFQQLDEILEAKVPENFDVQANLDATKELLQKIDPSNKDQKKALELVVALEDHAGKCDYESYLILAKNFVANREASPRYSRTFYIFYHFMEKYNENCLALHKQQYHEQKGNVKSLSVVRATLKEVDSWDFEYLGTDGIVGYFNQKDFVTGRLESLTKKSSAVIFHIVKGVLAQTLESSQWGHLKPYLDEKNMKKVYPKASSKEMKHIFNEYLFEPCEEYETALGETLSQGRLAAATVESSYDFLGDDKEFYKAIVDHRICKLALQDKSKLHSLLANEWNVQVKRML